MNRQIAWTLTLVAGTWAGESASAQLANPPATKKAAAPAQAKPLTPEQQAERKSAFEKAALALNPVLAEWEKRSAQITSLDVVFDMVERSPGFGDEWRRGRAMLQAPDKACLQFTLYKLDADHKPIVLIDAAGKKNAKLEAQPEKRIVCTGTEVLQYTWDNKTVTVYPLDKQSRQKALQEGPLPFLFNMRAADARQRYSMWLFQDTEKQYIIDIVPRLEIDQDSFVQARLWLNKATFLPDELVLVKSGGKEREEYKFNGANDVVLANGKMDQKFFNFQKFDGWKTVVNKGEGANPAGVGQVPPDIAQPKQQATKPGTRTTPR